MDTTARSSDEKENVKDGYIAELMTAYEELEALYRKERARNKAIQNFRDHSAIEISEMHGDPVKKIRVYLPEPKPAYSKYYNIKIQEQTTIKDMAVALKMHMKVSNRADWQVFIKNSAEA
jgi:hypothetical protein